MNDGKISYGNLNEELAWSSDLSGVKVFSDKPAPFTPSERAVLDQKIYQSISQSSLNGLITLGPGNFTYLTGALLPFAESQSGRYFAALFTTIPGKSCIILPPDWALAIKEQGWLSKIRTYSLNEGRPQSAFLQVLFEEIKALDLQKGNIGIELQSTPHSIIASLTEGMPEIQLTSADDLLRELRLVKTDVEIKLLETAVREADRAFVSALNHMEGNVSDPLNYDLWEFTERVRVHVGEFGGSGTGNLLTLQGTEAQIYYRPPQGVFIQGNLVRTEVTNHYFGYWANAGRTFVVGEPSTSQLDAYQKNIFLKTTAENLLKPGVQACEIFDSVKKIAQKEHIPFWETAGAGHGVGTCERESPYLTADDSTVLQAGMVVVLAIYTFGPEKELIVSKDTFVITDSGSRRLSWYRNWDKIYTVYGDTARHG
jgi:Xaa-Pro dipeptidase